MSRFQPLEEPLISGGRRRMESFMQRFDIAEGPGEQPSSGKKRLKIALLVAGAALLLFIVVVVGLLAPLVAAKDARFVNSTVFLSRLCAEGQHAYRFTGVLNNPASAAAEVTGVTLELGFRDERFAFFRSPLSAPMTVSPGANQLDVNGTFSIARPDVAGGFLSAFFSRSLGDEVLLQMHVRLGVRIYGALSFTLPFTVRLDMNRNSNANANATNSSSAFDLRSLEVLNNSADGVRVDLRSLLSGSDALHITLPQLSVEAAAGDGRRLAAAQLAAGVISGQPNPLDVDIRLAAADEEALKATVRLFSDKLPIPLQLRGGTAGDASCVAQQVMGNTTMNLTVPAAATSSGASKFLDLREITLDSDQANAEDELPMRLRVAIDNDSPLRGELPQLAMKLGDAVRIRVPRFPLTTGSGVTFPLTLQITSFADTSVILQDVLDGRPGAVLPFRGDEEAPDLLSRVLSAYVIDLNPAAGSGGGSSSASIQVERAGIQGYTSSRLDMYLELRHTFSPLLTGTILPSRISLNGICEIDFFARVPEGSALGRVGFNITVIDYNATAQLLNGFFAGVPPLMSFRGLPVRPQTPRHAVNSLLELVTVPVQLKSGSGNGTGSFALPRLTVTSVDGTSVAVRTQFNTSFELEGSLPPVQLGVEPGIAQVQFNFASLRQQLVDVAVSFATPANAGRLITDLFDGRQRTVRILGLAAGTDVITRVLRHIEISYTFGGGSVGSTQAVGLRQINLDRYGANDMAATVSLRTSFGTVIDGAIPSQSFTIREDTPSRLVFSAGVQVRLGSDLGGVLTLAAPSIDDAAAVLQELTVGTRPSFTIAGVAGADVISKVLATVAFRVDTSAPSSGNSSDVLQAISLAGAQSLNDINFDVVLNVGANTLFTGQLPQVAVTFDSGGVFAELRLESGALSSSPLVLQPHLVLVRPQRVGELAATLAEKRPLQLAARGKAGTSDNLVQSILQRWSYTLDLAAPSSTTVPGGSLPAAQFRLVSSTATRLTLEVKLSFTFGGSFQLLHGAPTLTARHNGRDMMRATMRTTPLNYAVSPGANELTATVEVLGGSALEGWASEFFRVRDTPMSLHGVVRDPTGRQFRPNALPVRFTWAFVLPANASGGEGGGNDVIPCFELGLTTPFRERWEVGNCGPFGGCRCGNVLNERSSLCAVGKDSPQCNSAAALSLSQCVDMFLSILGHMYVHNPLDLPIQLNSLSLEAYFDFLVASKTYPNVQNVRDVHLASINEPFVGTGPRAILNPFPIVVGASKLEILSFWLQNENLRPNPLSLWKPGRDRGEPAQTQMGTAIMIQRAYEHSGDVPLALNLRDVVLQLQVQNFVFNFRFNFSYVYSKASGLPDFLTDASIMCSYRTNKRPPCWMKDRTKAPNCFLSHFQHECVDANSPRSYCGVLEPVWNTLFNSLGDICCRDAHSQGGLRVPHIRPLCYLTEVEHTGTFRENLGSCPANAATRMIESGYLHDLISWTG